MKLAITGGTGFVGSHLIEAALAAGHSITALTRRDQPERAGIEWISGDLAGQSALHRLVEHADAVIHAAGVLKARDAAEFHQGNVAGTLAMLAAATAGGVHRFVHVSSLAAREPQLSLYGASKAKAETLVESSGLDWEIVRPPAVYGPGDRETLDLFKMAHRGQIFMPPAGRASFLHVDDLARLLLALAEPNAPPKLLVEPDDGKPGGWSHREFGETLAGALGVPARTVQTPRLILGLAARADQLLRGRNAKLTADRVGYLVHSNWVADRSRAVPADLWTPKIATAQGLATTNAWYRAQGWL